ncbi:MAG: hypothetical protein AAF236_02750, partial [Verrucomicrobiota bacterium]
PSPALEISGYPYDALRLIRQGDRLRLIAGAGYDATLVVENDGNIIPIRDNLPMVTALGDGDEIRIDSLSEIAGWTLGSGASDLTPPASGAARPLGRDGTGVAYDPDLPESALTIALHPESPDRLRIRTRTAFPAGALVRIDGESLDPATSEWEIPWQSGATRLSVARPDPLNGSARIDHQLWGAGVTWASAYHESPRSLALETSFIEGDVATLGGSSGDTLPVFGLPRSCLELSLTDGGQLSIRLHPDTTERIDDGETLFADSAIPAELLELASGVTIEPDTEWALGPPQAPWGGRLRYEVSTTRALPKNTDDEPVEVSGELPPEPAGGQREITLHWLGNTTTNWPIPNRRITLPMLPDLAIPIGLRRRFSQAAYPLKRATPHPSRLTSSFVSGFHNPNIDSLSLLQTDPGITVLRKSGASVAESNPSGEESTEALEGEIAPGTEIRFLQLVMQSGESSDSSLENPLASPSRLATRKRFAGFHLESRPRGSSSEPVVRVEFSRPEIHSLPLGTIEEQGTVAFGLNEISGFSSEKYQIRFRNVSDYFRRANARVELSRAIEARDDYRTHKADYGESFAIGGRQKLHLRIAKHTVPFASLGWLIVGAVISLSGVFTFHRSFSWSALFFGAAFLTCARLIFSRSAFVNAPYHAEAFSTAQIAVVIVPLILLLGGWIICPVLLNLIHSPKALRQVRRVNFSTLSLLLALMFGIRVLLLFLGAKEAVNLGFTRFALTIIAVPFHILVLSGAVTLLFQQRKSAGQFDIKLVGQFALFCAFLLGFEGVTALLVSDVGLFLFMIPQIVLIGLIGILIAAETIRAARHDSKKQFEHLTTAGTALLALLLPVVFVALVLSSPRTLYAEPFLANLLPAEGEIATGSTELRVLQFINREQLMSLGTDAAERVAQDHAIMENYARRGLWGLGYSGVDVIPSKYTTALNDNVSAVFIFAQFGIVGALAVIVAYFAVTLSSLRPAVSRLSLLGWAAVISGVTFSLVSLYMMAANYGFLPFTGRNLYLLGLDSKSDLLEASALLFLIALGLCAFEREENLDSRSTRSSPAA